MKLLYLALAVSIFAEDKPAPVKPEAAPVVDQKLITEFYYATTLLNDAALKLGDARRAAEAAHAAMQAACGKFELKIDKTVAVCVPQVVKGKP